MKSFSQFLQESYLNEEPAGRPAGRRTGGPSYDEVKAEIDAKEAEKAKRAAARQPSGAAANPDLQFKTSKVTSPARGGAIVPYSAPPKPTAPAPTQSAPPKPTAIVRASPSSPSAPIGSPSNPQRIFPTPVKSSTQKPTQLALPAAGQTSAKPPVGGKPPVGKPPMVKGFKAPGVRGGSVLSGVIDTALEKSSGSGWARSLAKGTTTALGTLAGGAAGSFAGPIGTFAGQAAGAAAASKAFDIAAGANAVQRKAMATANRQSQSGGALRGIGGKTTFDTKKGTMTTGSGSQQRTVKLGKTSVVTDPKTGKQDVGYLAYKGGKAVYKRADTKNLAQTSSNPLERIGRSLFAGAYKQSDAAAAAKKLAAARQSDVARQKALNVKMKPGG